MPSSHYSCLNRGQLFDTRSAELNINCFYGNLFNVNYNTCRYLSNFDMYQIPIPIEYRYVLIISSVTNDNYQV